MAKTRTPVKPAPIVTVVPLSDLKPDPSNPRLHGERNRATIRGSLARFGAGRSLVLDAKNVVRAGNGTLAEAENEGFTEAIVVEPKPGQLVAVRRPDWSEVEATGYSIADNRASEQAEWQENVLAETLEALRSEPDFDLDAVGFTSEEIDRLLGTQGDPVDDPQGEWEGMPEYENEDKTAFQTIHVHFKDQAAVDDFARLVGQNLTPDTRSLWFPEIEIERYKDKSYAVES